jgi:hypothetical protein
MTTQAKPKTLAMIAAATSRAAEAFSDEDERVYFLVTLAELDWTAKDARWRVAGELLTHDQPAVHADPLTRELRELVVQIADQTASMIDSRGEHSNRGDLQAQARELRDATDRLCSIVYAATAVHALGARL